MENNSRRLKRLLIEKTVREKRGEEKTKKKTSVTMAKLTPDDRDAKRRTTTFDDVRTTSSATYRSGSHRRMPRWTCRSPCAPACGC